MMKLLLIILLLGCDGSISNINKNTYDDDIADITFLNNSFFTTNYDLSMDGGSQIDLFKFYAEEVWVDGSLNVGNIYLDDSYDLLMNGQGYLAITNDGNDIYLQSKETKIIYKVSPIGERDFMKIDSISLNWQPCGIAYNYNNDSLVTLYRNLNQLKEYRFRTISKNITQPASSDFTLNIDFIDTTFNGIYSMEYYDSKIYMLGVDTLGTDILISYENNNIEIVSSIEDSTIIGICKVPNVNGLFFSYKDRRFEKWSE